MSVETRLQNPNRARNLVGVLIWIAIVTLGAPLLSFLAFRANFLGDVKCTDRDVAQTIYDHSKITSIKNITEISFDEKEKKRTCLASATIAGEYERKLTFIIDTTHRGQAMQRPIGTAPLTVDMLNQRPEANKFTVSFWLAD
jgi:hypothetical protein